uniref:Thioredoxin domain-containing protein n=1 Tax=Eucampia antarctica TaxID=49252 RepID=A0A7S2WHQ0_9STRA|mmetsp:Transcript_29835/g.28709  ORF Transcript_29835/g.28709 Transcript_29835/m.28709 type:complete len:258 (+) Transcript_29835:26-799(+)
MDLGYGNGNQVVGHAVAAALKQSTKAQEVAIQEEIGKYDALLEAKDEELDALRERRLTAMKKAHEQKQRNLEKGHGVYSELSEGQHGADTAREFFEASKQSDRMVVHFYRPTSAQVCDVVHAHLTKLAAKHVETRFVKINVDSCTQTDGSESSGASYLVDKLGIVVMPTIVIIKDRKAVHHIRGFDELGGTDSFPTEVLEWVIGTHGGIISDQDMDTPQYLLNIVNKGGINGVKIRTKLASRRRGVRDGDYDFQEDD